MSSFKFVIAGMLLIIAGLFTPETAQACSCLPPDLVRITNTSDHVMVGVVKRKRKKNQQRYFLLEIDRTFKGCYAASDLVVVQTSASGAMCGTNLQKGKRYLITGYESTLPSGSPAISINICGFNVEWQNTTATEREYLNNRPTTCTSSSQQCANNALPTSCLVDPCTTYTGSCKSTCVANYCGGCNREFYQSDESAACPADWSVTPP